MANFKLNALVVMPVALVAILAGGVRAVPRVPSQTNHSISLNQTLASTTMLRDESPTPLPPRRASNFFSRRPRPQIYVMNHEIDMDRLADASRRVMGELATGVGQVFQRLFAPPSQDRSSSRLFQGESILGRASKLLPSTANRIVSARSGSPEGASSSPSGSVLSPPTGHQSGNDSKSINYELEGQRLRHDIAEKVGHLQTILMTAMEVSRERRDLLLGRILQQTHHRLERARERAEHILSEPATTEFAVRTLHTISQGISNMHYFLQDLMSRINVSIKVNVKEKDATSESPLSSTELTPSESSTESPKEASS